MKKFGVAVAGSGMIAQFHIKALKEIEQARLAGVFSRSKERAREVGEREGCFWTTDIRELVRRPDVDLVIVGTSSGSHAPITLEALGAGKHAMVEKPMSMTVEEADRMIAAAKGRVLSVVSQRRFEEQNAAAKRAVDEGAIGKLLLVEISCPFYRTQEYYAQAEWRGTIAHDGGALMNQGIHLVDLMLWFAGPAKTVFGRTATQMHKIEAEDMAVGVVTFQSGALGSVMASTNVQPGFQAAVNLYGDKGTIKIEGTTIAHWTVPGVPQPQFASTGGGGVRDPKAINYEYHKKQIIDVLDAVGSGRKPVVTAEDGRRAVGLIQGLYASSKSGAAVVL